jgi:hypothetical protein
MWFAAILPVAPVRIPPTDGNLNNYMPRLKTDYTSRIDTFLAKKIAAMPYGGALV